MLILILFALVILVFVLDKVNEAKIYRDVVEADSRTKRLAEAKLESKRTYNWGVFIVVVILLTWLFTANPPRQRTLPVPPPPKDSLPPPKFNPRTMEGTGPLEN